MDRVRRSLGELREIAARRLTGQEGQGLVEYSLILLFVAVALVGALVTLGGSLSSQYASFVSMFPSA